MFQLNPVPEEQLLVATENVINLILHVTERVNVMKVDVRAILPGPHVTPRYNVESIPHLQPVVLLQHVLHFHLGW